MCLTKVFGLTTISFYRLLDFTLLFQCSTYILNCYTIINYIWGPNYFLRYLLIKTWRSKVVMFLVYSWRDVGLVIISQRDRIEQHQRERATNMALSSIRILSIQTGVHMMERLVMRWRWYWTLTSSIPLLLPWLLSTVENFDVMYFGLIIGPIFLNQKVFRFQFCMLCF